MGGSRSIRAVFSRPWEAYGHGWVDDALHLSDPGCELRMSVTDRVHCKRAEALAATAETSQGAD